MAVAHDMHHIVPVPGSWQGTCDGYLGMEVVVTDQSVVPPPLP
jgi:hypothetical protein